MALNMTNSRENDHRMTESNSASFGSASKTRRGRPPVFVRGTYSNEFTSYAALPEHCSMATSDVGFETCNLRQSFTDSDSTLEEALEHVPPQAGIELTEERRTTAFFQKRSTSLREIYGRRMRQLPEAMEEEEYVRFSIDSSVYRCVEALKKFVGSAERSLFLNSPFPEGEVLTLLRLLATFYNDVPATVLYVNSSVAVLDSLAGAAENFFLSDDVYSVRGGRVKKTSVRILQCNTFTDVRQINTASRSHRICFLSDKQFLDLLTTNRLKFSLVVFDNFVQTTPMMMACMDAVGKIIRSSLESSFKTVITYYGSLEPSIKKLFDNTRTLFDEDLPLKTLFYSEKTNKTLSPENYIDDVLSMIRYLVGSQISVPVGVPFGRFSKEIETVDGDILVFALSASEALMLQYAITQDFEGFGSMSQFNDAVKVVCLTEYSTSDDLPPSTSEKQIKVFIATDDATKIPRVRYVIDSGLVRRTYFNASLGSRCTEVVPISKYSAGRRASYAVSLITLPRIDEVSIQAGGVVFRLYSLEQYSSLKLFDEPSERDGEMQLLPMYRKVLKLDYRSMKSGYGRNAESRDFVRLLPTMSPEYMAFLREAKDEPLVPFYRKLFLVTLLSLSPVINSNLEAKFLLDEPCRFSSTSYFTLFVTKILNRLRGAADFDSKDRSWNFMERIAGYVKKRMDVLASSLFNLVEAEDWAEETTPADMELLYMALHHRDVHLYRLDIEKKIRYTVCLKKNDGTECLLHPCDGVDFFAPNSSPGRLAFHLLETRKGSFSALSPVTASYGKSFRPRVTRYGYSRKVYVGPHGRRSLFPNNVNPVLVDIPNWLRNVFLSSESAHESQADLFLIGKTKEDLDAAMEAVDRVISAKYSDLLDETCEISSHGVGKKYSSTIIVGAGGITVEHIFNNETRHVYNGKVALCDAIERERKLMEKTLSLSGKPTVISAHDGLPTSGGLIWSLAEDVPHGVPGHNFTPIQKGVKFHERSRKYSGIKCSCPKALKNAVGKITIDGNYSVQIVINALLKAFPQSIVACKRFVGSPEILSLIRWYSEEGPRNEDDVYVFELAADATTNYFASVVRQTIESCGYMVSEAYVIDRDEVEQKVLIGKVDAVLQSSLSRSSIARTFKVLRIDFEATDANNIYVWGECKSDDLHALVGEMRRNASMYAQKQSQKQKIEQFQVDAVFRQYYILSGEEHMIHQTAIAKYIVGQSNLGNVAIAVSELSDGSWIVNFESAAEVLLDRAFQAFLAVVQSNRRLTRDQCPGLFTRKGIAWLTSLQNNFWPYLKVILREKPSTAIDLLVDPKIQETLEPLIETYCRRNSSRILREENEETSCCACFHSDEERKVILECGHSICEECRSSWINVCVTEGQFPLCCPELNCQKTVVWKDIEKWLICGQQGCLDCTDHEEMKKLSRASYRHYLNGLRNLHLLCSTPDCVGYFTKDMAEGNRNARCPECNVMKCLSCGACTHEDFSCEEHEAMTKDSQRALEYWIQKDPKNRRGCVVCKMLIVKDAGCNHMHCRNCGTHFCWICDFISDEGVPGVYKHLYDAHRTFV